MVSVPRFTPHKDSLQLLYYPPVLSTAPVLSGTFELGQVLSVTPGTWTNPPGSRITPSWPDPTILFYWLRDGVDIFGYARPTTYTLTSVDLGHEISVQVVASNRDGSTTTYSNTLDEDSTDTPPPETSSDPAVLLSDGTSLFLLSDGVSRLLLNA